MKPRSVLRGLAPPEPGVVLQRRQAVVSVSSFNLEESLMNRRNLLWVALLGLPLAVVGGLAYANNSQKAKQTFTCPITGEELPCSKCCPLNGADKQAQKADGFTCPVTGEQLPCEKCCPLNGAKADAKTEVKAEAKTETKKDEAQPFICPITGEELGCPNCCPLNKSKKK